MCFRALLYAVFHSIRIGFEGSKLKIVDQKASDGRVSQSGFQFLRWLYFKSGHSSHVEVWVAEFHRDNPTVKSLDWVPERA